MGSPGSLTTAPRELLVRLRNNGGVAGVLLLPKPGGEPDVE